MRASKKFTSVLFATALVSAVTVSSTASANLSAYPKHQVNELRHELLKKDNALPAHKRQFRKSNGSVYWLKLDQAVEQALKNGGNTPTPTTPPVTTGGGKSLSDYDKKLVHTTRLKLINDDKNRPANQRLYHKSNGKVHWINLDNAVLALLNGGSTPTPPPSAGGKVVKLTWSIPTKRQDGKKLQPNEIKQYEIYVTDSHTGASKTIKIANPSQTSYQYKTGANGTYHFSMVTVDKSGVYSNLSPIISKKVN